MGRSRDGGAAAFELADHGPTCGARVNVPDLHHRFEAAVAAYHHDLVADPGLRASFLRTFERCGLITIGRAVALRAPAPTARPTAPSGAGA